MSESSVSIMRGTIAYFGYDSCIVLEGEWFGKYINVTRDMGLFGYRIFLFRGIFGGRCCRGHFILFGENGFGNSLGGRRRVQFYGR